MATEANIQMSHALEIIFGMIAIFVVGFELFLFITDRSIRKLDEEIKRLETEARKIQRFYVEDTQTVKRLG